MGVPVRSSLCGKNAQLPLWFGPIDHIQSARQKLSGI